MKAMILAAGLGSRMGKLTAKRPKPLLCIGDEMLIAYHLLALSAIGVTEVVINVSYLGEQIQAALGDGSAYGVSIQYSVEEELLGTGGGIYKALPLLGDEPFILISADIWSDYPLAQLPKKPEGLAHLVMVDNPEYHHQGDYHLDKGSICLRGTPRLNYAGIAVLDPALFKDAGADCFAFSPILEDAIKAKQVSGEHHQGCWFNIGTPDQLEAAQHYYESYIRQDLDYALRNPA